jgi:hypothetical protein
MRTSMRAARTSTDAPHESARPAELKREATEALDTCPILKQVCNKRFVIATLERSAQNGRQSTVPLYILERSLCVPQKC